VSKRRLPLLQTSSPPASEQPERPAWQWVGFGAAAIFAAWVPLSSLAGALAARIVGHASEAALPIAVLAASGLYAAELALGALAGGFLVGRWGPVQVGARHGALSGLVAAGLLATATALSVGSPPGQGPSRPSVGLLLLAVLAPLFAALGARLGVGRRRG